MNEHEQSEEGQPDQEQVDQRVRALTARLRARSVEERRKALDELGDIAREVGPLAAAAIPTLTSMLGETENGFAESIAYALHYCCGPDVEPIVVWLTHADPRVRERACHALGLTGDEAIAAAPPVRRLLDDADPDVRKRAAWTLGLMHDSSDATIDGLFALIGRTVKDRAAALHALGNIGQRRHEPLLARQHQLIDALGDADADVRRCALYAIESLQLPPERHAALLMHLVSHDADEDVRAAALDDMRKLAGQTDLSAHVPQLVSCLHNRGRESSTACEILGAMGLAGSPAVPTLIEMVQTSGSDEDDYRAIKAAGALWKIARQNDVAIPLLRRQFSHNGEMICDLIYEYGPAGAPLIPELISALADHDYWDLQWAAADALGQVASSDPEVMAALTQALKHDSPVVQSAAAKAFRNVGLAAMNALCELLDGDDSRSMGWAADILGAFGPTADRAVPRLRAVAKRSDDVGIWATVAVAGITGDVSLVGSLLELMARDDRTDFRQQAAVALGAIGPKAGSAASKALKLALEDEYEEVRVAAREALDAMKARAH